MHFFYQETQLDELQINALKRILLLAVGLPFIDQKGATRWSDKGSE